VDVSGRVLRTFTDVELPIHLSLDSEGRVLVADCRIHRILLLNSQLELQRVLIDTESQVKLWQPTHICYSELTSQLFTVLSSKKSSVDAGCVASDVISVFSLHSSLQSAAQFELLATSGLFSVTSF